MGCVSSICSENSELILSHHLEGKLSDITAHLSEKSTDESGNSLSQKKSLESKSSSVKKFNLLKSIVKFMLKDLPNFVNIFNITESWFVETLSLMQEYCISIDDLKVSASFSSDANSLTITHEFDAIRSYNFIKNFYFRVKNFLGPDKIFDIESFLSNQKFLLSLCPLTISFYLTVGTEIDFGIGAEKSMDLKQIRVFFSDFLESSSILNWIAGDTQPIPTFCNFSVLRSSRKINFCIFDGLKNENLARGLSLFEIFGAPIRSEVNDFLHKNYSDEVNCCIEFDEISVKGISIQVQNGEVCDKVLDFLDTFTNVTKWKAFHSFACPKFVSVELNSQGFLMNKVSLL